ncbi:DUF5915 domain-containing protein [Nocardia sp. NBC_01377]|uniref:DUF5915 domain-containing protein n=1 Tax=Nocardia sp. NBC_01377 TaxID=2903595 RepID=UPI00324E5B37
MEFDGATVTLGPDEVIVSELPRTGWVVETQRGATIALDIGITAELAAEGVARDVVRVVQNARRDAGLAIADRIELTVAGSDDILATVKSHETFIATETLATSTTLVNAVTDGFTGTVGDGAEISVRVVTTPGEFTRP